MQYVGRGDIETMGGCQSQHSHNFTRDDEASCPSSVSQMCCVFVQPAHVKCIQHISVFNMYTVHRYHILLYVICIQYIQHIKLYSKTVLYCTEA